MAVADLGLHAQEHTQVPGRPAVGLAQHGQRLIVTLALRMLPEADATDDIRGGNASVDAQRDECIRVPSSISGLVGDQVRGVKELASLAQATAPDVWGARVGACHFQPLGARSCLLSQAW
ncbi:MAG TPA: hypothetical protein VGI74_14025, partial [Streptosporangiaceae bacterium]